VGQLRGRRIGTTFACGSDGRRRRRRRRKRQTTRKKSRRKMTMMMKRRKRKIEMIPRTTTKRFCSFACASPVRLGRPWQPQPHQLLRRIWTRRYNSNNCCRCCERAVVLQKCGGSGGFELRRVVKTCSTGKGMGGECAPSAAGADSAASWCGRGELCSCARGGGGRGRLRGGRRER
jgi:hypothetical protein